MSRATDVAWAAGLFEGEGCFTPQSRGYGIRMSLCSTDFDVLERFHSIVATGNVQERIRRNEPNRKEIRQWVASEYEQVARLASLFWPYLGTRRRARFQELDDRRALYYESVKSRKHGTHERYTNYRCRCAKCRAANRRYQQAYRQARSGVAGAAHPVGDATG